MRLGTVASMLKVSCNSSLIVYFNSRLEAPHHTHTQAQFAHLKGLGIKYRGTLLKNMIMSGGHVRELVNDEVLSVLGKIDKQFGREFFSQAWSKIARVLALVRGHGPLVASADKLSEVQYWVGVAP